MRPYALLIPVAMTFVAASAAVAQVSEAAPGGPAVSASGRAPVATAADEAPSEGPVPFRPELLLDDRRFVPAEPRDDTASFSVHGEYALRFRANNDLPLRPGIGSFQDAGSLGQRFALRHWMRIRPQFQYGKVLKVVGELEFPRGYIVGDTTQLVTAARDDDSALRWYDLSLRKLYLEYLTPIGLFRVGHQASHWGMGILTHGGDESSLFGDYRRGALVERLLFATKPLGPDGPLTVALAGDLIWDDSVAQLVVCTTNDDLETDCELGDRALEGVLAVIWKEPSLELGLYGVLRDQTRDRTSVNALTPFTEDLTVGVVDLEAKIHASVPGVPAYVFAQLEAALIVGSMTYVRNVEQTATGQEETVRSFGGALQLGAVRYTGSGEASWGDVVVNVEMGYASGDANPYDGVSKRFTFAQNHNVGLVLFDHVLAWRTARSATIAQDPSLVARPAPGLQFLPSEGGVFGAAYINPTLVVRPRRWLDLKAGVLLAQTTADFVDPAIVGTGGSYANFDGGDPARHDLGVELDAGVDVRLDVAQALVVHGGLEGGVLLPGGALADARGVTLGAQYLLNTKLGVNF